MHVCRHTYEDCRINLNVFFNYSKFLQLHNYLDHRRADGHYVESTPYLVELLLWLDSWSSLKICRLVLHCCLNSAAESADFRLLALVLGAYRVHVCECLRISNFRRWGFRCEN